MRVERLRQALALATTRGFDHLVITGDLTEEGTASQLELFAALLDESGIAPRHITVVPGNHDVYAAADGWPAALRGALSAYSANSEGPVTLGDVTIVPVNTAIHQHWLLSHGSADKLVELGSLASALESDRLLLVAQHHPPLPYRFGPAQWFDGLRNWRALQWLVQARARAVVLHGHLHRSIDARMQGTEASRPCNVFCAPAVVSAKSSCVRFYEASNDGLMPLGSA
jgi:3',5'-cyclic AMP phosphodiesterase CpdA